MINPSTGIFNRQTAIHIAWYMLGLSLILRVGILPDERKLHELDERIADMQDKVSQGNALTSSEHLLKTTGRPALPMPEKRPMQPQKMQAVIDSIKETAVGSGLLSASVVPELTSIKKDSQAYVFVIKGEGELENLRGFLLNTLKLPYVGSIKGIVIDNEKVLNKLLVEITIEVAIGE